MKELGRSRGRFNGGGRRGLWTCLSISFFMFMVGLLLGALNKSSSLLGGNRGEEESYLADDDAFPLYSTELEKQMLKRCDVLAACKGSGIVCGSVKPKGCKIQVNCGGCMFPESCGGSGLPNVCGCKPVSCLSLGRTCGQAPDGCGGNLTCGVPCEVPMIGRRGNSIGKGPIQKPYRFGYYEFRPNDSPGLPPEKIEAGLFSHLVYKSGVVDLNTMDIIEAVPGEANQGKEYGAWRKFSNVSHTYGAIPIIGLNSNELTEAHGLALLSKLAGLTSSRTALAKNLAAWLSKYDFRGVELTWDCLLGIKVEGWDVATALKEVRSMLDQKESETGEKHWLGLSVWASGRDKDYLMKVGLKNTVDWVSLRPWIQQGKDAKPSSQLLPSYGTLRRRFDAAVAHWVKGVDREKVVLGVPAFATVWRLSDAPRLESGEEETEVDDVFEIPYGEIREKFLEQSSSTGGLHPVLLTAYAKQDSLFASYQDKHTLSLKVDYVVQKGLLGYGIWMLNSQPTLSLARTAAERTMIPQPVPYKRGKVVIVSSGYTHACKNKEGDNLLGRSLRNKIDYAQHHGYGILYNVAEMNPNGMWTKQPLFKHLLPAHPDVEWFFWVDGDAFFTDVKHPIPFEDYEPYDLIVPGYGKQLLSNDRPDWCLINAGVFLIRNTLWALAFMDEWWEYGNPAKDKEYGELFTKALKGRDGMGSDDQSALAYMLITNKDYAAKTFFENRFALHGYWKYHVGKYQMYFNESQRTELKHIWNPEQWSGKQPPFMSHFVGCKMCASGGHYNQSECFTTMDQALNFAEDQFLLEYRLEHVNLNSYELRRFTFSDPSSKSPVLKRL